MPTILGSNSASDAYDVANSLRFNRGDGADLSRTPSADGNRKTFTFSTWFKLGIPPYDGSSADYDIFSANSTNNFNDNFRLRSDGQIQIQAIVSGSSNNGYNFRSDMLFRDPSAWYHLVVGIDTTQSTNSDGVKVYINGSLISGTYHAYNQNISTSFNKDGSTMALGHTENDGGNHHDGYLSETHFIDGTQLDASYFGETNDNGVWIPKQYTGSYGTNGFFLEYQQTGTSANSSGMGADTSGNDHHFTPTNLAATDVTTDTPTNNFATLNPLDVRQGATFSEGNCKIVTNSSNRNYVISTIGVTSGKWYCEAKITGGADNHYSWFGTADFDDLLTDSASTLGDNSNEVGFNAEGGYQKNNSNTNGFAGDIDDDDIVGIALDLDNNRITHHKNGQYANGSGSYNQSSPSSYVSFTNSTMGFAFGDGAGADTATFLVNFGNSSFSISSGNSDANGYGNFEYAVPSGYYALCTKNLAEYG